MPWPMIASRKRRWGNAWSRRVDEIASGEAASNVVELTARR